MDLSDSFMRSKDNLTYHFPYCKLEYQKPEYRDPNIVAEIHAHNPDIMGLQEVDANFNFLDLKDHFGLKSSLCNNESDTKSYLKLCFFVTKFYSPGGTQDI